MKRIVKSDYINILYGIVFFSPFQWCRCHKNIPEVEVSDISLDKAYLSLAKSESSTILSKIMPYAAVETPVKWKSYNPFAATVTDVKVTANPFCSTVVTAKSGGQTGTCSVTVKADIIGTNYFDGWSGINQYTNNPNELWAINAPSNLSKHLVEELPGQEPIWEWHNDTQDIMERQIDFATETELIVFFIAGIGKLIKKKHY